MKKEGTFGISKRYSRILPSMKRQPLHLGVATMYNPRLVIITKCYSKLKAKVMSNLHAPQIVFDETS